jgi:DNA-binding response OmpR family regulator
LDVKQKILLIEDEVKLARFIELELIHEGYDVDIANDGAAGLELFVSGAYQLILLDLMLPKLNGMEVLRRIRKSNTNMPVIMITAKGEVMDRVVGLDSGASDYIIKPFAIEEVLARIRVVLKTSITSQKVEEDILRVGELVLDVNKRRVFMQGVEIELTKTEYELLYYLLKNKNMPLTREQILNAVWDYDYIGDTKVVDVYVRYLRIKIDDRFNQKVIYTMRGIGYLVKD